jgi:hypothetical protein
VKVASGKIGFVALLFFGIGFGGDAYGQSVFTVAKVGKFHHILSDLPSSYDLVADSMRVKTDSDSLKDFVNTDSIGFDGKWKAGNATNFVRAPGYPTFNAQTGSADFTFAKIDSLYKAGTPVVRQDDPGTGSKHTWIAKLRGGSEYVIIKFGTILGGSSGTGGETTFSYWKMPSKNGSPTGLKIIAGADQKSIRMKSTGGHYEIGLDGRNAGGMNVLNLLGQAVPQAKVSQQKYLIPIGN